MLRRWKPLRHSQGLNMLMALMDISFFLHMARGKGWWLLSQVVPEAVLQVPRARTGPGVLLPQRQPTTASSQFPERMSFCLFVF